MKLKLACLSGIYCLIAAVSYGAPTAAPEVPEKPAVPPITANLLGWKPEKGNIKVLEETQKGPDGGLILRLEGEASMSTTLDGFVPGQETTYSISYSFRRLSPGNGWAGCVQVFCWDGSQIIRPITYQKRYPDSAETWTKVTETFKTPTNGVNATFQIMTKAEALIEITDLKCTYVPAAAVYR